MLIFSSIHPLRISACVSRACVVCIIADHPFGHFIVNHFYNYIVSLSTVDVLSVEGVEIGRCELCYEL